MTPYPEINILLDRLVTDVQAMLGEHFRGMYLYGSLALGDFVPHRSDIDVLVATREKLPTELIRALGEMHRRVDTDYSRWGSDLEVSYLPIYVLRRYNPLDNTEYPHKERHEKLIIERQDAAQVIQGHILRESGITLAGPPPDTLIDPVSPDDLRRATADIVLEWWKPMLDDPSRLYHRGYQVYAVLTMCRVLYTLAHGTIVSKPEAGRWARQSEAEPWKDFIDWALAWEGGEQRVGVEEAVGLIGYVVKRCGEWGVTYTTYQS